MTIAEAWFNIALRPRKPEGSLGRTAQDVHLDSHTALVFVLRTEVGLGQVGEAILRTPVRHMRTDPSAPLRDSSLGGGGGGERETAYL